MKAPRAALLLALVLAGCVRTSGTVEIAPEELPFQVGRGAEPTGAPAPARTFAVYFIREEALVGVRRTVEIEASVVETAMRTLLDGTTSGERRRGIASGIPDEVRLLGVVVNDGTALVDLSGEFQEPAASEQIALRVAQVVWTLTELPGVGSVGFAIDGEAVAVTTSDGIAVARPVARVDYATLGPTI